MSPPPGNPVTVGLVSDNYSIRSRVPLEYQPSDTVLSLKLTHHKRRCADYIDLKKVLPRLEAGVKSEPRKVAGAPFLFEEPGSQNKKTSDVNSIPMCWVRCVRILCYSYALVSAGDGPDEERCNLDGVMSHLATVESYARMDSKAGSVLHSHLVEAESSIRHERHRILQQDTALSLNGDAQVVGSPTAGV